jgi:hypothetical protein
MILPQRHPSEQEGYAPSFMLPEGASSQTATWLRAFCSARCRRWPIATFYRGAEIRSHSGHHWTCEVCAIRRERPISDIGRVVRVHRTVTRRSYPPGKRHTRLTQNQVGQTSCRFESGQGHQSISAQFARDFRRLRMRLACTPVRLRARLRPPVP